MNKSISNSERLFLENGIDQGIRNDGRELSDFRPIFISLNVINSANGSSRIRNDELDILVAVKCEITSSYKDGSSTGSIFINIDCANLIEKSLNIAPSFTEDDYLLYLTNIIKDMCFKMFDNKKLTILDQKLFWNIYIDVMILSFGGNMIDWIVLAIHAALRNTRIPKITINSQIMKDSIINKEETNYSVSPCINSGVPFPFEDIPFVVSAGYIKGKILWDMNLQEEICSKTIIALSINSKGECVGINKIYSNTLDLNIIPSIINDAIKVSSEILNSLDNFFIQNNIKDI